MYCTYGPKIVYSPRRKLFFQPSYNYKNKLQKMEETLSKSLNIESRGRRGIT